MHNDDSNASRSSFSQDGGENSVFTSERSSCCDSSMKISNGLGTDGNIYWTNERGNETLEGRTTSRTTNSQGKESDSLFENIEATKRKSPQTDDKQIWQRLEDDRAFSDSRWIKEGHDKDLCHFPDSRSDSLSDSKRSDECPNEQLFLGPDSRGIALNDSNLGRQTVEQESCHNSGARNDYFDGSKKRKRSLDLQHGLCHGSDPKDDAFSDSKKRKCTLELEHEICWDPDSRRNGFVDGRSRTNPLNLQSYPNCERDLQEDSHLRYREETFNSDKQRTNAKSPFSDLDKSVEAETTNGRSPDKPRMLDLQSVHWPKSPLTGNSRSLLHFPDNRAYHSSDNSRHRRFPDRHSISHNGYLSDKAEDRFDTYHQFTMSEDESVWHARYSSSPSRGPESRGRFLSGVEPDKLNSDNKSDSVSRNLKRDVQDSINQNRYQSSELSGRVSSVSPLSDTESEHQSNSWYPRRPHDDLTDSSRYRPYFMHDQLRPDLHFPNRQDRGIPFMHRPKLTSGHSPERVEPPSSPVSPFSPSTPVPMCLPYPHPPCSGFQYPCRSCSLPGPFYRRSPYHFPPPFLPLPAGIPHFPQSMSPIADKRPLSKQIVDGLVPQKGSVDQKHIEASVSESPLPPLAVHIPKKIEIKRTRKEPKMRTIKEQKKTDLRDAAKESNGKSQSQKDSGKCLETSDDDKVSAEDDAINVEDEENEKLKRMTCKSRKFTCKFCGKVYVSLGALKMHIRTHTLPCKCNICGKAFSRPWLLQGHIRTHTGEKPYKCHMCQRAFADRSNLRAHLQTHSDVKKYSCRTCHKTFSRMSLLVKHEEAGCLVS